MPTKVKSEEAIENHKSNGMVRNYEVSIHNSIGTEYSHFLEFNRVQCPIYFPNYQLQFNHCRICGMG